MEAMNQGIAAVTQEPWKSNNRYCRLELPQGKFRGVVARLVDPCSNLALGNDPEKPIGVILLKGVNEPFNADPDEDAWEPWTRPDDYARLSGESARTGAHAQKEKP